MTHEEAKIFARLAGRAFYQSGDTPPCVRMIQKGQESDDEKDDEVVFDDFPSKVKAAALASVCNCLYHEARSGHRGTFEITNKHYGRMSWKAANGSVIYSHDFPSLAAAKRTISHLEGLFNEWSED
jgi:hypothetical protein